MAEQIKINSLVPPTWNRLKVNDVSVELPAGFGPGILTEEVKTEAVNAGDWNLQTGCGEELTAFF